MTRNCSGAPVIGPFVVALVLGSTLSAHAQARPTVQKPSPNVEIGAAISGFFGSGTLPGIGLRVGGGNGGRVSVEGELHWMDAIHKQHYSDQLMWFYSWQVKHALSSEGTSSSLFVTFGTAGWIQRQSVAPGRLEWSLLPPMLPIVGIGWQQVVAKHMAIRGDGQLLIGPFEGGNVVPRISVGVSIPIRGYRLR